RRGVCRGCVRRRRLHEPCYRHLQLYRRPCGGAVAALRAGRQLLPALPPALRKQERGGLSMDVLIDILGSANFWAASLRIATPLIFGVLGALLCERAGVLNLGIEGIFVAGAMAGWLAVYLGLGLWGGVLVAACAGAFFG